jgi:hypothetical protein
LKTFTSNDREEAYKKIVKEAPNQPGYEDAVNQPCPEYDPVNHPKHYTNHPSGVECIQITRHMGFNLGNAIKYIWRCDLKKDDTEDLKKAVWYLLDEINLRLKQKHEHF